MTSAHVYRASYLSSIDTSRTAANDLIEFWHSAHISSSVISKLELCVVELLNNTFEHAYKERNGYPVDIECRIEHNDVHIEISHYGEGLTESSFNAAIAADFVEPNKNDPLTLTTSGRGLIIVASLLDSIQMTLDDSKSTFYLQKKIAECP
ncbi:ATP-binding protein [Vibrio sp. ZSDZ34]|jgi:serine/threonine-protein kinase RsbW|uniref:ATP-binding protein n=1 Tax=Vibrio gelatinilyticus TaxID=2893468 RepID=A0A9X1W866_9VIBR|nr:ATP-binding protein [Vibrio gelatinilyticus]MCJ2375231.1 ATP-binding protein [Vibrio gelatinilyticus]